MPDSTVSADSHWKPVCLSGLLWWQVTESQLRAVYVKKELTRSEGNGGVEGVKLA